MRSAQAASSRRTRAGARGSANVAVPTCTARGAGEQQLGGVGAADHAADPDDRQVGQGGVDVVDGAHRDGVDGRAGQPAARGARTRAGSRRSPGRWPCRAPC